MKHEYPILLTIKSDREISSEQLNDIFQETISRIEGNKPQFPDSLQKLAMTINARYVINRCNLKKPYTKNY
jgi:hypothetical protein